MALVNTYDTRDLLIFIDLLPLIGGFSEDSKLDITTKSELYKVVYDKLNNMYIRVKNTNIEYEVKFSLLQNHMNNSLLNQYLRKDKGKDSNGYFTINIFQKAMQTRFYCEKAFIQKDPDVGFKSKISPKEWIITCPNGDLDHGFEGSISDALPVL